MSAVADLLALQETDLALDKALARLAEIDESLGESEELIEARAQAEATAAVLHEIKVRQKDAELQADEARTKAADVEKKLYSGSIRNPKELQDLELDLKSLREQLRRKEDELLAVLEEAEAAETEATAAAERYAAVRAAWEANRDQLLAERAELEPEAERLRAIREGQAAGIDRSILSLYDAIRSRRGGRAVARVERGMCQGCRISLPVSVLQRARTGNGLIQCVSCERILLD